MPTRVDTHSPGAAWARSFQSSEAARSGIAEAALNLIRSQGQDFAYSSAPLSQYGAMSGNQTPGMSRLEWLRNRYKCNQFVGEALIRAGFKMPTFRMKDGSVHFMNAERLPRQFQFFDRITSLNQIQAGDLLVQDYPGRGEDGAHVEVVVSADLNRFLTAGAHFDGAYLKNNSALIQNLRSSPAEQAWRSSDVLVYLLRPKIRG